MLVANLVRSHGGFARRRDLLVPGVAPRALASAVRAGILVRPRRGLYCVPEVPARQQHAALHGGALTCGAALVEHGVWLRDRPEPCILLLDQGHALRREECATPERFHHRADAPRFGLDDPVHALGHYLRCAPDAEAIACAVESCLARGLVSSAELALVARGASRPVRETVAWCRATAGSGLETIVRLALSDAGVKARSQVRLPGVGVVDLLVGDCLVVEVDGRAHHASDDGYESDRRRDAGVVLLGGAVLRFSSSQVTCEIESVVGVILAAIGRGMHLSTSSFGSPPRPAARVGRHAAFHIADSE
nr:type IV toxin-antitoxin system AbiEi family antitoxin domain-containing protein [Microcella alkalica]